MRMYVLKAARPCCQIIYGLLGKMRVVVVEDNANSGISGIVSIKGLE